MKDLFYRLTRVHRFLDDEIGGELKRLRLAVKDRLRARFSGRKLGTQVGH